ncbi:MAG: Bifunctional oligoribonuclease and PAP phosphatase NrnA [Fimbriimonadaceae bacterium]|nr:Bifunctional oligoribonuclease and PAP phosphatase NrnA [Fimbriimonadaceae bacterium]
MAVQPGRQDESWPLPIDPALVSAFRNEILSARSVLVGTHLNPDGDALGSALALSEYLRAEQVDHEVLCNNAAPANLRFLPGVDRIRQAPVQEREWDLGIVLDLDTLDRLGKVKPFFESCARLVVIDHHVPHEAPGNLRIVDTSKPATAVILANLLVALGATITPPMATCLLAGIVTDTGSFRFRNTTPESLEIAARLLSVGGSLEEITENVYHTRPLAAVRLLGVTLERIRLRSGNRLGWSVISADDYQTCEAMDEHTEGFVNEILSIDTVQIAALIRQPGPGRLVRCSLRSRGHYDVAEVARQFGGGGHRNAAGCTFETTLEEAELTLVAALEQCLASS